VDVLENRDGAKHSGKAKRAELDELLHRTLVQLGDMKGIQERLRCVSERLSKITRSKDEKRGSD
jgi:hypothetical protein